MLATMKELLDLAESKSIGIAAFDTPNLENVIAVIKAAEELDQPVIIMHVQAHEGFMPLTIIGPIMVALAKTASVPVCVHLDHGETLEHVKLALSMGFTSVMYDGSVLPFDENVANTITAVKMAKKYGASVEAEIGVLGVKETADGKGVIQEEVYTDPDEAKRFVDATGIDALACSFGTVHGLYLEEPNLDMSVVENVRKTANIPIVMHGGSGVSDADFIKAIKFGVRKVNYYTYMAKAGGQAVKENILSNPNDDVYFHDLVLLSIEAMKQHVKSMLKVFHKL